MRRRIDGVDRELVRLLAERSTLVRHAVRLMRSEQEARAPDRVEQVITGVRRLAAEHGADPDLVDQVYRSMIAGFVEAEPRALGRGDR